MAVAIDFVISLFRGLKSSDTIVLRDSNQVEVDRVEYTSGTSGTNGWPSIGSTKYQSMALNSVRYDNNAGSNWCASSNRWYGPEARGYIGTPRRTNDCGIIRQPVVHASTGAMGIIITGMWSIQSCALLCTLSLGSVCVILPPKTHFVFFHSLKRPRVLVFSLISQKSW
jgi:hypothetical protein